MTSNLRVYLENGHTVIEAFGHVITGFERYEILGSHDEVTIALSTKLFDIGDPNDSGHCHKIMHPEHPTPEIRVAQMEHELLSEWGAPKEPQAEDLQSAPDANICAHL